MFTRFPPNIQGIILGFLGFSFFSAADTAAKYLTQFYSVFQIVGLEAFFLLLLCLILARPLGGLRKTLKTQRLKIHILRALCNTMITVLVTLGLSKLPMTLVYTLVFISPFITALLAIPFFREKVDPHGWVAIGGGFTGVLIVMRPGLTVFDGWILLPVVAAFFIAASFLLAKALGEKETLLSLALFPALSSTFFLMPITWTSDNFPLFEHLWIFALCGVAFLAGLICLATAFQKGKSSIVAPIQYVQILWGAGFGYLLFGDTPDLWTLIGAALIIGSGIYLLETERNLQQE